MEVNDHNPETIVAQALVERIQSGDLSAEAEMVQRYQPGLRAILLKRADSAFLVEEVAQATWEVVIPKIRQGEIRAPEKLGAFIMTIGKNQLIMAFRKNTKLPDANPDIIDAQADTKERPDEWLQNRQLGLAIRSALDDLPQARDRELITQFFIKGKTKQELCEQFALTPAHFDRVLYRARNRFKAIWHQQ